VGAAEHRVIRPGRTAQRNEDIEKRLDCRPAKLGIPGVRRLARGNDPQPEHASRGRSKAVVGGLTVDEKAGLGGDAVRGHCSFTPPLLPCDKHHPDPRLALRPQAFRRRHLRRQDALGIARATSEQEAVL
jgi:hypothetical protein